MSEQSDVSTIDLDEGEGATIHSKLHVNGMIAGNVDVHIMVLEAQDGHLKLLVEQDTTTTPVPFSLPTVHSVAGSIEDPG